MSLRISERKWFNKTVAAFKHNWLANFRSARSADNFVRGIAGATGLPASTIRKSLPFKNFRAAQRDGKSYLALALKNIRVAFKAGTWRKNYLRAFGGVGAAAARPKRKKRKTKKKKKATKKKGGKKKIYGTKSAAKSAATKGRYPYKVKGGWSLSKKAKKKKSTKKRSTKKSTKKRSTKKKGKTSRKKKYPTKSAAKKAATKGRYPYKVKGGWCLSKKK